MVVGEPQILGQVKESYTIAREVGAVSTPPRISPPAHLHRSQKNPHRNPDRFKLRLHRIGRRRPGPKNLRLASRKDRPPRRRGQDVRTRRPPSHPARRSLHPRRQPHPVPRRKDRRRVLRAPPSTPKSSPSTTSTSRPPAPTSSSPRPAPRKNIFDRSHGQHFLHAAATAPCSSSTSPSPATSTRA